MKPYILPTTAQVAVKMNQQLLQASVGIGYVPRSEEPTPDDMVTD